MSFWKLLIALVVMAAVALFVFDGVSVLNAKRDVVNVASASASAAASAIATSTKNTTTPVQKPPVKGPSPAELAADKTAQAHGDVVTAFAYDAVAARVKVTVSGSAKSFVLHYFDKNLTNNIKASATAQPG
jgi:Flp pilus assembly protein TadG